MNDNDISPEEDRQDNDYLNPYENYYTEDPQSPYKDSVFRFFRDLLKTRDSRKIGNLLDSEVNTLRLATRHYLDVANYNFAENKETVGYYLASKGEIILATSLSRKGFLDQLFVTQIKRATTMKKVEKDSKGLFSGKKPEE